jgi:F-type H+-transporting ATPase subunit b
MNINATLLAQAIVFIIFVVICMKYVYPQILAVMQEREKRISDGLEAAKKADDSLEEAKLAFDKELNQAKEEAADILKKANTRASQIVADAFNQSRNLKAEKIMTSASASIESETNRAKEDLRQQMSDIIIDTTEKILGDEISSEKHDDILKKAAKEL